MVLLAFVQARMQQRFGGVSALRGASCGHLVHAARHLVNTEGHKLLQLLRPWMD